MIVQRVSPLSSGSDFVSAVVMVMAGLGTPWVSAVCKVSSSIDQKLFVGGLGFAGLSFGYLREHVNRESPLRPLLRRLSVKMQREWPPQTNDGVTPRCGVVDGNSDQFGSSYAAGILSERIALLSSRLIAKVPFERKKLWKHDDLFLKLQSIGKLSKWKLIHLGRGYFHVLLHLKPGFDIGGVMSDDSKRVRVGVQWRESSIHSSCLDFRAAVEAAGLLTIDLHGAFFTEGSWDPWVKHAFRGWSEDMLGDIHDKINFGSGKTSFGRILLYGGGFEEIGGRRLEFLLMRLYFLQKLCLDD
ncbi:hypothetical protein FNV43_RR12514 [Rhamnella rubrinervis]|uniref:Uncharacterized protein n=1 Tax=Rhamnella rubrinervis TaxID=2594499 RepID=A0A8K0H8I4_9ROSA|nr:hypothetical protein FNV43_RR12514 [Rhamnella rubrinervis]